MRTPLCCAPLDAGASGFLSFASVPEIFILTSLYHFVFQLIENSMPEIFFWNIQNPAIIMHSRTKLTPQICQMSKNMILPILIISPL